MCQKFFLLLVQQWQETRECVLTCVPWDRYRGHLCPHIISLCWNISKLRLQIDKLQCSFRFFTENKYIILCVNLQLAGEEQPLKPSSPFKGAITGSRVLSLQDRSLTLMCWNGSLWWAGTLQGAFPLVKANLCSLSARAAICVAAVCGRLMHQKGNGASFRKSVQRWDDWMLQWEGEFKGGGGPVGSASGGVMKLLRETWPRGIFFHSEGL